MQRGSWACGLRPPKSSHCHVSNWNRSEPPTCKGRRRHFQHAGPGGFCVTGAGARLTSLTHRTAIRPPHLPRHVPKFIVPLPSPPCSRASAQASSWDPGDESQTDRAPGTPLHEAPGPRPCRTQSSWTFRIQVPGPRLRGGRRQRGQSGAQRALRCCSQACGQQGLGALPWFPGHSLHASSRPESFLPIPPTVTQHHPRCEETPPRGAFAARE